MNDRKEVWHEHRSKLKGAWKVLSSSDGRRLSVNEFIKKYIFGANFVKEKSNNICKETRFSMEWVEQSFLNFSGFLVVLTIHNLLLYKDNPTLKGQAKKSVLQKAQFLNWIDSYALVKLTFKVDYSLCSICYFFRT